MWSFFMQGGFYMWFLLIFTCIILGLSIKKAIQLFGNKPADTIRLDNGINAILFWGGISLLVGFFAHFHGIYSAMQAISHAADISPAIVAAGYGISLITILSGMFIFILSLFIWFILRWRLNRIRNA
jgi:hypothetical protein